MKKVKTVTWLCEKEGRAHRVNGKGAGISDAFKLLPKYQQLEATFGLVGIEINGVRQ